MEPYFIKLYVKLYINNLEDGDHVIALANKEGIRDKGKINVFVHNFMYSEINEYSAGFIELLKLYSKLSDDSLFERYAEGYRNYSSGFGANTKFIEQNKDDIVKEIRTRVRFIIDNV